MKNLPEAAFSVCRCRLHASPDLDALQDALSAFNTVTLPKLRELRLWHWTAARDARATATSLINGSAYMDGHSLSRMKGRAKQFNDKADIHIRFVQALNDMFEIGETAENDFEKAKGRS